MTEGESNNPVTVEPSGIMYVYVGGNHCRMCLRREKWDNGTYGWSATKAWDEGIAIGNVFGHWHEMMAYVFQRQALTPAEYQAAYEMLEAK